ncbi:MAG: apolipoprotein N-acyltransferase [Candidatus Binatia bacterium]|nr:apolipoprotein N-acyltransferase [Candidatus Binatia bacterium]
MPAVESSRSLALLRDAVMGVLGRLLGIVVGAVLVRLYAAGQWPHVCVGWVVLVPWLVLWRRCGSIGKLVVWSVVATVLFTLSAFGWFVDAVAAYTGWSYATAAALLSGAALFVQPQLVALALTTHALQRQRSPALHGYFASAFLGAAVYTACDWFAPTKLLGDTLGLGLWPMLAWAQAADLGGVYLLTFILLCVNIWIAGGLDELVFRRSLRTGLASFGLAGATIAAVWLYGWARLVQLERTAGVGAQHEVRVGVVQGNISHYERLRQELGAFEAVRQILQRYLSLSATLDGEVDLWTWPETVYPTTFARPKSREGALFDREIAAFVQFHRRPLVFGAYDRDDKGEYNAAFFLVPEDDERGLRVRLQRKLHPFLFTEHVPRWMDSDWLRQHLPWLGTWRPGSTMEVVEIPVTAAASSVRVAALICYDAVVPGPAREAVNMGADLLLSLSNDSWFERQAGKRWALIASALRSIETRRPQVRVTPTGLTASIDETGRIRLLVPPDQAGATVVGARLVSAEMTLFVAWGSWVPLLCLVGSAIVVLHEGVRWLRARR